MMVYYQVVLKDSLQAVNSVGRQVVKLAAMKVVMMDVESVE